MPLLKLIGFRGTGGFDSPRYRDEPALVKAGHVGIQIEDDDHIYGFHPTTEAIEGAGGEAALIELLKNHTAQPGCVQNDTAVFERAYQLAENGERTQVWELIYELPSEEYERIQVEILDWYNTQKEYLYNFPLRDGDFADNECNCALFPRLLGIDVPSENGHLRVYIQALIDKGARLWQPKPHP